MNFPGCTAPKINIKPKNHGLEDGFPFPGGYSQDSSRWSSRVYDTILWVQMNPSIINRLFTRRPFPLGASPTVATDLPEGVQSPAALDQLKGGELPDTKGVG